MFLEMGETTRPAGQLLAREKRIRAKSFGVLRGEESLEK